MDYKFLSINDFVAECGLRPCAEAWEEFIRRFHRLIASVVFRGCRECGDTRPEVTEDLIQEIYLKLAAKECALLRRFQPLHENAFLGYLKCVTINLVYDHFRKEPVDNKIVELNEAISQAQNSNTENEIFFNEIDRILRQRGDGPQEQKERAIFWLYYRQGLTAKEIASIPAVNLTIKGVESCIFRLTVYVKLEVMKRKRGENPGGFQARGSF